jgi:hypothetical protein
LGGFSFDSSRCAMWLERNKQNELRCQSHPVLPRRVRSKSLMSHSTTHHRSRAFGLPLLICC